MTWRQELAAIEERAQEALDDDAKPEVLTALESVGGDGRRWRVDGLATADWAMRKLAKIQQRLDETNRVYDQQRQSLDRWANHERERLASESIHWQALLEEWHRECLAADKNSRTIKLPHGQLHARKQPDEWTIDEDKFLPWANAANPQLVRTKVEVDRAALKKWAKPQSESEDPAVPAISPDGEIVPGVYVFGGAVKFTAVPDA